MSITSDTWSATTPPYPDAGRSRTRDPRLALLDKGAIGLAALLGGFVIREPAPYELFLLLLMALYVLAGMTFGRLAVMLTTIWVVFNFGGMLSMFTMGDWKGIPLYLAVSLFLGLTSVFWCAAIQNDAGRLRVIMRGYVLGAAVTAVFGILGYFGAIPGAEQFTLYNRAKGLFQDPNVFGPFLVLPTLYLLYGLLYRSLSIAPIRAALLLILLAGLFLSFSRAAWGLTVFASGTFFVILLMTAPDAKTKFKLVTLGVLGVASVILMLVVALQFDTVSDMFSERAKVVQDYDGVRLGRFARHFIGFEWGLSNPLGIGPLEFGLLLGEDTHNIYVKSLMAYGWIGFAAWMIMTIYTIVGGAALLGRRRPWQPYLQAAWCVFLGHIFVGWVIDLDHWRHVYLLIGIIWGCMALERRYQTEGVV
ncbi:MAG: O-antigen ligase family protein [Pseudomonadota bacterium]